MVKISHIQKTNTKSFDSFFFFLVKHKLHIMFNCYHSESCVKSPVFLKLMGSLAFLMCHSSLLHFWCIKVQQKETEKSKIQLMQYKLTHKTKKQITPK